MKIIVQFLKLWLWLLAFMTLLPIDCLAQTNYELVIEMRDGTKRSFPITNNYPVIRCNPFYDMEIGRTMDAIRIETSSEVYEDVKCDDIDQLYTQEAVYVSIIAKSYEIEYGDDLPQFEYTIEGATVEGTPSITCEVTKTSPVGIYPIVITNGTVTKDNVTYVNGTLTIKKAPLKITAKDYTIKQGEALPTFEATYEGFKNDEKETVLTKQPVITTTATASSEPGEYEITVSGAEAQNYEISYVKGKLTIEAAEPVVIDPVDEDEIVSFSDEIDENTDLSDNVVGNTYFNMDSENGDGYDAASQALILNSTTSADQMSAIQGANVGDASIRDNYNGIIFELASGKGTVTVDVQTIGTHLFMVQIGNNTPTKVTKSERGTVDVPYNVAEPTYVYLYARTADGGAARLSRAAAGENSVLLYGYKVTIGDAFIPGDVNGDGLVNVTDIVATVNFIMEKPSDGFNKAAADLSGDGDINVTDIVKMVSIIMNGNGGSSRRAAATSSHLVINRNNIQLKNAEAYTAAQFDINLSDGQSINNVVLNVSSDHSLYWKMVDANTYRVVVYSMTNAAFRANSDNLFTVFMTGSQNATISNELLIKADGTTGIDAIRTEIENGNVYDLNGRQVKTPGKGVYIIKTDNKTIKITRK